MIVGKVDTNPTKVGDDIANDDDHDDDNSNGVDDDDDDASHKSSSTVPPKGGGVSFLQESLSIQSRTTSRLRLPPLEPPSRPALHTGKPPLNPFDPLSR